MTAPNIDMIASSLRNCSLNYQNTPLSPSPSSSSSSSSSSPAVEPLPPPPTTQSSDGSITVELNSAALPFQWEQCLDIRTGQVYYINWEDGSRTTTDPRTKSFSPSSSDQEDQESDWDEETINYNACNASRDSGSSSSVNVSTEKDSNSNISSTVSSFSPTETSSSSSITGTAGTGGDQVLVAAGCKACFMYFMIPKFVDVCPKCGGSGLIHLDRA